MKSLFPVLLLLTLVCAGCGGSSSVSYSARVSSFADASYSGGRTYVILPADKDGNPKDLEFLEYASVAEASLAKSGHSRVADRDSADLVVYLSYSISNPTRTPYTQTLPVYGNVGGQTTDYTIQTKGPHGAANTTATATSQSSFGVVGYTTQSGVTKSYTRTFALAAYDNSKIKQNGEMVQVWKTTVVSEGSSDNLRGIIPYLAKAAEDSIGASQNVKISIDQKGNKVVQ